VKIREKKMKRIFILILMLCAGLSGFCQNISKQIIFTDKAPKPIGPYSQAVMSGNTLYLSGQIAIDPATNKMDTASIGVEIRRVMGNIREVLKAAGMDFANIVKTTIYTTDLKQFTTINSVYGEYFDSDPPARETVQVAALPKNAHVEVSCIAVK
jgi:2-iminobutanoate/2-iminopropanoate deaminase